MKDSVIAVTVTFNSSKFLYRAIEWLKKQTYPISKIIVVDNNSNVEEKEILRKLDKENEDVEIIWLENNTGGAGGFYEGMKYAKEHYNPDWYWLMDDDAFPKEDCLQNLLNYSRQVENVGCLAPLIYGIDNKEYQLYHHKKLAKFLHKDIPVVESYDEIQEIMSIEADAFVGPLFSKLAVDSVGIADDKLFIYGDDLEYTYRVSRKFNVYLIKNALINHQDQPINGIQKPTAWWKDYYMYRNRLLFIVTYQNNWILRQIGNILVIARVLKQMVLTIVRYHNIKLIKIRYKLLAKSVIDGLMQKKGKTIDPIDFVKLVNSVNKK